MCRSGDLGPPPGIGVPANIRLKVSHPRAPHYWSSNVTLQATLCQLSVSPLSIGCIRYPAHSFRSFYEHEREVGCSVGWSSVCGTRVDYIEIGPQLRSRCSSNSRRDSEDMSINERATSSPDSQFPESTRFVEIKALLRWQLYAQSRANVASVSAAFADIRNPRRSDNITRCPAITKEMRRISGPAPVLISTQSGHAGCTCK